MQDGGFGKAALLRLIGGEEIVNQIGEVPGPDNPPMRVLVILYSIS